MRHPEEVPRLMQERGEQALLVAEAIGRRRGEQDVRLDDAALGAALAASRAGAEELPGFNFGFPWGFFGNPGQNGGGRGSGD